MNATRNEADYEDRVVMLLDHVTGFNILTQKWEKVVKLVVVFM